MKSRETILNDFFNRSLGEKTNTTLVPLLEVLLDIRDLLANPPETIEGQPLPPKDNENEKV